ncbi:TPA: hypothetical protein DDZ86_04130 [Candidatus Dependentiae bacterium]|nr:MAG: hypothetical protein UW09_C0003G0174 [candidate division TM6 bacterium GW2011_GWF2_43_87]HBL98802.1 hypothetical protein [Candidatus Dependentiae bacterium]
MVSGKQWLIFVYIVTVFTGALYGLMTGLPKIDLHTTGIVPNNRVTAMFFSPRKAGIITDDKMATYLCNNLCSRYQETWSGQALKNSNPRKQGYCICLRNLSRPN